MFGNHYYNRTIRRLTVAFGSLFNDIKIARYNPDGSINQMIQVPLSYGPGQKWFRVRERAEIDGAVEGIASLRNILPRMSYSLDNIVFDAERMTNTYNKMAICENGRPTKIQSARVPFNLNFSLHILTKKTEDSLQILEQVLPYFTPSVQLPVIDMPELGIVSNIPFELEDISQDDNWETDLKEPRELIWTLTFVARAWLYFPTKDLNLGGGLIETVYVPYYNYIPNGTDTPTGMMHLSAYKSAGCDILPESTDIYPDMTLDMDSFVASDVISAKYLVLVEDPEGIVFRTQYQILVTHNGTSVAFTRYNEMGDTILHTYSAIIEDGRVKIKVTNNQTIPLQIKFIRMEMREPTNG